MALQTLNCIKQLVKNIKKRVKLIPISRAAETNEIVKYILFFFLMTTHIQLARLYLFLVVNNKKVIDAQDKIFKKNKKDFFKFKYYSKKFLFLLLIFLLDMVFLKYFVNKKNFYLIINFFI